MRLIYIFVVSFFLLSCGGGSSTQEKSIENVNEVNESIDDSKVTEHLLQGRGVDGEIAGALIFLDLNLNGSYDSGEPSTTTDNEGYYQLLLDQNVLVEPNYINRKAKLILEGGFDIRSKMPFEQKLKAVIEDNTTVYITPVSTIIATLVELNSSVEEAKESIARSFDLPTHLLSQDPIALLEANDKRLYSLSLQLHQSAKLLRQNEVDTLNSYLLLAQSFNERSNQSLNPIEALLESKIDQTLCKDDQVARDIVEYLEMSIEQQLADLNQSSLDNSLVESSLTIEYVTTQLELEFKKCQKGDINITVEDQSTLEYRMVAQILNAYNYNNSEVIENISNLEGIDATLTLQSLIELLESSGEFQELLSTLKGSIEESATSPSTPPTEPITAQSDDLVVKIKRTSEWNSGFCEEVEVYNATQEPKIWSVEIEVVGEIYTLWNANYQHDTTTHKLSASGVDFNRAVGANSSVSFGYCVNKESQSTATTPSSTQTDSYSSEGLEVTQRIQSDWESGYCSDVIISNKSSEDKLWSVTFEAQGRVNDLWNAHYTQDAQSLMIEAQGVEYNRVVKANESVTIGYCASKLSSVPTTPPTSTPTPMPTIEPTPSPTLDPTPSPTPIPTVEPSPTPQPSPSPTPQPTQTPVVEDESNISSDTPSGYRDALDLSMSFYEAQRASGPFERVTWRQPIASGDGSDVGVDLDGGWFDAGDHVKFNLPMSYSATMLIWSMIDNPNSYQDLDYAKAQVRYALDYLLRSYDAGQVGQYGDDKLYYQVGDGNADHDFWGPPEDLDMQRPTAICSGDEGGCAAVSGSMAAAFASGYMLLSSSDTTFANQLLSSAKEIYAFAKAYPTDNDYTAASPFYQLFDDNKDQLAWGAIWLYLATNEMHYLEDAKSYIANKSPVGWVHSWDNVTTGVYLLLAQITNENSYHTAMEQSINHWINNVPKSPAGLRVISEWGSLRYASTQAFITAKYASLISDSTLQSSYLDFARLQIDYILGDNPLNFSYQIGFGKNYPLNPHHRGAHASPTHTISSPANNTYTLAGALVGGPLSPNDYDYQDDRSDYKRNEVATDYNAGFSAALANLIALEE